VYFVWDADSMGLMGALDGDMELHDILLTGVRTAPISTVTPSATPIGTTVASLDGVWDVELLEGSAEMINFLTVDVSSS
jgi:hypothetical protein